MTDFLREAKIRFWMCLHIQCHRVSALSGQRHKQLIFSRSARQIERMERSRGLL
ncbi:MAG: hypothetical protein KBD60_13315 [Sterolibacterium sp.]|jgi:hypothetical protein|nr:hypothetical protein [Sterolibacterium sp.]